MRTVDVILRVVKELQLILLANPEKYRALKEPKIISYILIKTTKPREMYAKGIKKWEKETTSG